MQYFLSIIGWYLVNMNIIAPNMALQMGPEKTK
jgi:hypothetical protein